MNAGNNQPPGSIDAFIQRAGQLFGGFRLGPGIVGNMSTVLVAAFLAAAFVVWALSSSPIVALGALVFLSLLIIYIVERCMRFAEKYPAAALLGGTEFYNHLRDQSARDPSIVTSGSVVQGLPPPDKRPIGSSNEAEE